MPKKAKRVATPVAIDNRFISQKAKERYDEIFDKKKPIPERGFKQDWVEHDMGEQLEQVWGARGWSSFVAQPPVAVVSVAKEFYSNMDDRDKSSRVRGVEVRYDYRSINSLFDLPAVDVDAYRTNFENVDHLVVLAFLCPTGTQWKYENGLPRSFPKRHMMGMGKFWFYFVGARLLPIQHLDDVTKERAYMVYTILTGGLFDVGYRIAREMEKVASGVRGGLWFPSLITQLCRRAGVLMENAEGICPPKGVLDRSLILRISVANFPAEDRENVQPRTPASATPQPRGVSSVSISNEELAWRQKETVAYMHSSLSAINDVVRGIAANLQMDIGHYRGLPARLDWSYPTDDEESDEEEDDDDA